MFTILLIAASIGTPTAWLSGYLCGYAFGPRTQHALLSMPVDRIRLLRERAAQALILLLIANNLRLKLSGPGGLAGQLLEVLVLAAWFGWVLLHGMSWGLKRWHTRQA